MTKPSQDSETMWGGLMTGAPRWMPDTLASLVVGRNSRFFTEELDDEELEQIGGVEYRALRLLSYAVAAVSLPAYQLVGLRRSSNPMSRSGFLPRFDVWENRLMYSTYFYSKQSRSRSSRFTLQRSIPGIPHSSPV